MEYLLRLTRARYNDIPIDNIGQATRIKVKSIQAAKIAATRWAEQVATPNKPYCVVIYTIEGTPIIRKHSFTKKWAKAGEFYCT